MLSQMAGQSKPIYKAGNLKWKPTRIRENYSKEWKQQKKSTKTETLLKLQLGQMPTVPVMAGNEREENPPRLPTPRRAALASARHKMQAIRAIGRPEGKHACCMAPGTLRKSAKYSRITPPSMPHSGNIKKNPNPAAKKKRGKTVHFDGTTEEVNIITACDYTYPKK